MFARLIRVVSNYDNVNYLRLSWKPKNVAAQPKFEFTFTEKLNESNKN